MLLTSLAKYYSLPFFFFFRAKETFSIFFFFAVTAIFYSWADPFVLYDTIIFEIIFER